MNKNSPTVTPEHIVDILNSAFKADPAAITSLFINRVPCNNALAEHPTIIVGDMHGYVVGLTGLLNGLFPLRDDGLGWIAAKYENNKFAGFTTEHVKNNSIVS